MAAVRLAVLSSVPTPRFFFFGRAERRCFSEVGVNMFYICLIVYLYGDLAIYAAAVPMSLMEVACGNHSCSAGSVKYNDTDLCWGSVKRKDAYRVFLTIFTLLLGPFTFFNAQKTKYLQILTSVMRWIGTRGLKVFPCAGSHTHQRPGTIRASGTVTQVASRNPKRCAGVHAAAPFGDRRSGAFARLCGYRPRASAQPPPLLFAVSGASRGLKRPERGCDVHGGPFPAHMGGGTRAGFTTPPAGNVTEETPEKGQHPGMTPGSKRKPRVTCFPRRPSVEDPPRRAQKERDVSEIPSA
ncbi:hypothetical protein COCON_G00211050 [Conger conger]|uniref:Uncharacterized protein n=1 Tax=Conger conger TaxID=82655 RepID=A0A9Q1D139_CONCO|nr:hypothetical protein COCON_G00211050 [Conger conger]